MLTPFVALESDRPAFFFPAGSTITVVEDAGGADMVKVMYEGREVAAFWRDIQRRTQPITE